MKKQLLTFTLLLLIVSLSHAQYKIDHSVLACGATSAGNNANRMVGTVGQCIIGQIQNTQARASQGFWYTKNNATAVERIPSSAFKSMHLEQNYPNPAVSITTVEFSLPSLGSTTLSVTDVLGRIIMIIPRCMMNPGTYQTTIDVTSMVPGMYFLRLQSNNQTATRRMTIIR